ncbi:MAG: GTP cyclohydrolase FolE2 [Candidatus Rokuibacteriota bacterium]
MSSRATWTAERTAEPLRRNLASGALPDVVTEGRPAARGCLDRVGMTGIETIVTLPTATGPMRLPASIDAFVSLDDPLAKGIHMSRIVLAIERAFSSRDLTTATVVALLRGIRRDQGALSRSARLVAHVAYPVGRESLRSGELGTRIYPVRFGGTLETDGTVRIELGTAITYSSTCPCSAALARELLRERFVERFGDLEKLTVAETLGWLDSEEGILPVPHSQRSRADVRVEVDPAGFEPTPLELIDLVERALGTPVQAAVKRIDEQEFARLNAANPLFCEDAARRVAAVLASDPRIRAHSVRVEHEESLHPHNAVAAVASPTWSARGDALAPLRGSFPSPSPCR